MEKVNITVNLVKTTLQERIEDILVALIIIVLFILFSSLFSYCIIKVFKWKEKDKNKIKQSAFYKPIKIAFIILGIYLGALTLNLKEDVMHIIHKIMEILLICLIAKGLTNIFAPNSILMQKIGNSSKIRGNKTLIEFISKISKAIIYIATGILIISALGYNLNGLIAGLGLGGVIVALAAQDLAKNLFGGAAILIDKPFELGDYIKTKEYEGTVVDITFRSTRVKTAEDTIVSIQNSKLSEETIINYAKMTKRRYAFDIKLPLQTNTDTIQNIINRIKFILENNKDIIEGTVIVECNSILADGINITVAMYTSIIAFDKYLSFRTNVNQSIFNVIEAEGIRLSNPTQDIYVKKFT